MNPHFFTAPFTLLSFGSGFRVQVAASPQLYNKAPSTSVGITFKKGG